MRKICFDSKICSKIKQEVQSKFNYSIASQVYKEIRRQGEEQLAKISHAIEQFELIVKRNQKDLENLAKSIAELRSEISELESRRKSLPPVITYVPEKTLGGSIIPAHNEFVFDHAGYAILSNQIEELEDSLKKEEKCYQDSRVELEHQESILRSMQWQYKEAEYAISDEVNSVYKDAEQICKSIQKEIENVCDDAMKIISESNVSIDRFLNYKETINLNGLIHKVN